MVGCWRISRVDARPIERIPWFWASGIRLDTVVSEKVRDRGHSLGTYLASPLGPIPASAAIDTALQVSTWEITARDSLRIARSDGFSGIVVQLRVQEDSLSGTAWRGFDVRSWNRRAPHHPVSGHRISCPPTAPWPNTGFQRTGRHRVLHQSSAPAYAARR